MNLPKLTIIGKYQILFDLQSNIIFKAEAENPQKEVLCTYRISSNLFLNLCELYPKTKDNLIKMALMDHKIFNHFKVEHKKIFLAQSQNGKQKTGIPTILSPKQFDSLNPISIQSLQVNKINSINLFRKGTFVTSMIKK